MLSGNELINGPRRIGREPCRRRCSGLEEEEEGDIIIIIAHALCFSSFVPVVKCYRLGLWLQCCPVNENFVMPSSIFRFVLTRDNPQPYQSLRNTIPPIDVRTNDFVSSVLSSRLHAAHTPIGHSTLFEF